MATLKRTLAIGSLALGFTSLISTIVLAAPTLLVEFGIDRVGQDYKRFDTNDVGTCMRKCVNESQCRAFTYVPPGAQPGQSNPVGLCWLKNGVPRATANPEMISGVKQ